MGREQPGEEHRWLGGPRHPVVKEHASLGQSETHEVLGTARPVHGQQQATPPILRSMTIENSIMGWFN